MTLMLLGLILFLSVHSTRIFASGWRDAMIAKLGPNGWKGLCSLVSLVGLVLIVIGYGATRTDPVFLWQPPVWTRHAASLLTLGAFVLLVAAYIPSNRIKAAIGHPMVAGVKLWAFAHLLANGTLADIVLFGSFLAWAVADFISARQRDRAAGVTYNSATLPTVATVVLGIALWAVFAFWLHRVLIGVAPFGR
ncbi:MAG: NnrU family protein [Rhodocyclaceae bacterium]|jgi:uncharacterized membrane protein|nr:NnrU family protein [Rhodocyclaceae bacterium]MCE2981113.1 NnrU family protein [Betaproteobacteria bacterium]MCA3075839.1 NnrU family protein [Rhodocyclaceae bacterium]MCA3091993.1 NnrU family protein [Rhodocyclaceae bacterium]MCA3095883.1 NnrU family protein [Rhodocyclaceae bacterium]